MLVPMSWAGELLGLTGTIGNLLLSAIWGFVLSTLLMEILVIAPLLTPSLMKYLTK